MKINIIKMIIIIAIISVLFLVWTRLSFGSDISGSDTPTQTTNSFEECVDAGSPIMESYPRKCRDNSGQLHVENVE